MWKKKPLFKLYVRIWSWIYKLEKKIIILSLCLHFFFREAPSRYCISFSLSSQQFLSAFRSILKVPFNSESVGVNARHHFNFSFVCDFCFVSVDFRLYRFPIPTASIFFFFWKTVALEAQFRNAIHIFICIPHFSHLWIENEWRRSDHIKMKHEKLTVIGSLVSPI